MAGILRGEVYWADLNPVRGREQAGQRPVVIISHEPLNRHSGTVIAPAITSQPQRAGKKPRTIKRTCKTGRRILAFEVTTLHKRFPYAVGGLFLLYEDAKRDSSSKARVSTFERAHQLLKMFTGRLGPKNEESKFEFLALGLYSSNPVRNQLYEGGKREKPITLNASRANYFALSRSGIPPAPLNWTQSPSPASNRLDSLFHAS
ncbi:MAG: type II toxin-antitoxin system PemK/MazF family toxin [Candidatus Acidiferrales bacterium]